MKILAFVVLLLCIHLNSSVRQWAILVSGSPQSWRNYADEADVCNAYQILHKHGIPDERIVVMMLDAYANDPRNPLPGKLYNRPGGPDVYAGCPKDYNHQDVTVKNFVNIIQGNKEAMKGIGSGKVIESTADDHIFFYFSDHGDSGVLYFPHHEALTAKTLNETLFSMYQNKQFAKMLIYIEACHSGSMFYHILDRNPESLNTLAISSSNRTRNSERCFSNATLHTDLTGQFSASWTADSDRHDLHQRTIEEQYEKAKVETTFSPVMKYGRTDFMSMSVAEFQGDKNVEPMSYTRVQCEEGLSKDTVEQLKFEIDRLEDRPQQKQVLVKELQFIKAKRQCFDWFMEDLLDSFELPEKESIKITFEIQNYEHMLCHHEAISAFEKHCFFLGQNHYASKITNVLGNLCETHAYQSNAIITAVENTCKKHKPFPPNIL